MRSDYDNDLLPDSHGNGLTLIMTGEIWDVLGFEIRRVLLLSLTVPLVSSSSTNWFPHQWCTQSTLAVQSQHLHWTPNTHFWFVHLIVLQLKCWDKEALKGTWSTDGNQEKSLTGRHPSFLVESAADSWWVRHLMPPQTKWKWKQSVLLQCPFDMYIYIFVCTLQMQSFCCWLFTYLSICFRVQQKMGFTFLAKDENGVKNKRKNSQASSAKNR